MKNFINEAFGLIGYGMGTVFGLLILCWGFYESVEIARGWLHFIFK